MYNIHSASSVSVTKRPFPHPFVYRLHKIRAAKKPDFLPNFFLKKSELNIWKTRKNLLSLHTELLEKENPHDDYN